MAKYDLVGFLKEVRQLAENAEKNKKGEKVPFVPKGGMIDEALKENPKISAEQYSELTGTPIIERTITDEQMAYLKGEKDKEIAEKDAQFKKAKAEKEKEKAEKKKNNELVPKPVVITPQMEYIAKLAHQDYDLGELGIDEVELEDGTKRPLQADDMLTYTDENGVERRITARQAAKQINRETGTTLEQRRADRYISQYIEAMLHGAPDKELKDLKEKIDKTLEEDKKYNPQKHAELKDYFDNRIRYAEDSDFRVGVDASEKLKNAVESNDKELAGKTIEHMKKLAPKYYAENAAELLAVYSSILSPEEIANSSQTMSDSVYNLIWTPELRKEYEDVKKEISTIESKGEWVYDSKIRGYRHTGTGKTLSGEDYQKLSNAEKASFRTTPQYNALKEREAALETIEVNASAYKDNIKYSLDREYEKAIYKEKYGNEWISATIENDEGELDKAKSTNKDAIKAIAIEELTRLANEDLSFNKSQMARTPYFDEINKVRADKYDTNQLMTKGNDGRYYLLGDKNVSFTAQELGQLAYMYERDGDEGIRKYIDIFVAPRRNAERAEKRRQFYATMADSDNPFVKAGGTALGFVEGKLLSPAAAVEAAVATAEGAITGRTINKNYGKFSSLKRGADAGRSDVGSSLFADIIGTITKDDKKAADLGAKAFLMFDSAANSVSNMLMGPAGNVILNVAEATYGTLDADIQEGRDPRKTLAKGSALVPLEFVTEMLQFKGLEDMLALNHIEKNVVKRFAKNVTGSFANELPGELVSSYAEVIADNILYGSSSAMEQRINKMLKDGEISSRSEGVIKYLIDTGADTAVSVALTSLFLGGADVVSDPKSKTAKGYAEHGKKLRNGMIDIGLLVEQAKTSENEITKTIAMKAGKNAENLTDGELSLFYLSAKNDFINGKLSTAEFAQGKMFEAMGKKVNEDGKTETLIDLAMNSKDESVSAAGRRAKALYDANGSLTDSQVGELYEISASDAYISAEKLINMEGKTNVEFTAESAIDSAIADVAKANSESAAVPESGKVVPASKKNPVVEVRTDNGKTVSVNGEYATKVQGRQIYVVKGKDIGAQEAYYAIDSTTGLSLAVGETKSVINEQLKELKASGKAVEPATFEDGTENIFAGEVTVPIDFDSLERPVALAKPKYKTFEGTDIEDIFSVEDDNNVSAVKTADSDSDVEVAEVDSATEVSETAKKSGDDGKKTTVTLISKDGLKTYEGVSVAEDTGYELTAVERNGGITIVENRSGMEFAHGATVEEAVANVRNTIAKVGKDAIDIEVEKAIERRKSGAKVSAGSTSPIRGDRLSVGRAVADAEYTSTLLEMAKTSKNEKARKAAELYSSYNFKDASESYRALGDIAKMLGVSEADLVKSRAKALYAKISASISSETDVVDKTNAKIYEERQAAASRGDTATVKALDYLTNLLNSEGGIISVSEMFAPNQYSAENPNVAVQVYGKRMETAFKNIGLDISVSVYYDNSENAARGEWTKHPNGHSEIKLNGAKLQGEQSAFWVVSHELIHEAESKSPGITQRMLDAFTKMGMYDGSQYEAYKARYSKKCEADFKKALDRGDVTQDDHDEFVRNYVNEEIVADLMSETMSSSELVEVFAGKLGKDDANVIVSFLKWIKNGIKSVFNSKDEFPNKFSDIIGMFEGAVKGTDTKSSDTEVTKESFSSIGAAFYGNEKMTANEMERMLNDGSWKESEGYKKYLDDCVNVYKQAYGKATKSDIAQIEKEIEGIMRVAVAAKKAGYDILDNGVKRSTKDSKNRLLFSSLEPNSDYITSSDISAICDKRKTFTEIYDEIVRIEEANNVAPDERFFSKVDNYFILHKKMAEKGLVIPCEECYVESMRKNLAPMANAFIMLVKETNVENTKNAQLYNQSGKNKGKLKENNAKIRERVIEICTKSNGTQEQIDKLKNLTADELAKFIDDVGSAENLGVSLDELTLPMLTTAEGLAKLKLRSPLLYEAFNSFYGQSKPKMPKEATPFRPGELIALFTDKNNNINQSLINKVKSTGGFRLQSYSDFQIGNFVDVLQTIFEASMLGLNGHAYTKVPAFLDATNGTNLKRNLSIFMYEDGGKWMLDKKNSFPMELDDIYALVAEDESGNTSIIAVSQNAKMSAWIMANDLVGYGIPFHKSGLKMDIVRLRDVKTPDGRTIKGYSNQIDHTKQQSEVYKYDKDGKKKNSKVTKPIDIYSFWDFENKKGLSKNELIEKNLKAYIDECEKAGYRPKFRDYVMNNDKVLKDVLTYSKELGFVSEDATIDDISFKHGEYTIPYGYYKFLGDFGMFTPEGEASPIKPLSLAEYDFDKAVGFFDDAKALREKELLQQFENGKVREEYRQLLKEGKMTFEELQAVLEGKKNEVVQEVVQRKFALSEDKSNSQTALSNSDLDTEYLELAKNPEKTDIRYSLDDTGVYSLEDAWAEMTKKYGAIPKGEKAARDVKVPKKISDNKYVSRTARSAIEAGITPAEFVPELQKEILDGKFTYERFPDEKAEAKAKETIEYHGFEGALEHWEFLIHSGGAISKENFSLGIALYNQCAQNGDFARAEKILADLSVEATRAGQAIQSMRLLKKMSADGTMYYLEKSIDKINDELVEKFGKKRAKKVKINEELARKYFAEKDAKKREKLYDELCKDIGEQIPSTFWEKADAWRYLMMLFNPTTHIRNVAGNVFNKFVIMADHAVEGALQPILVKRENRTRTWRIADKKTADFAKNDWELMKDVLTSGEGKYNNMMSDIDDNRRILRPSKNAGKAAKAVGNAVGFIPEVLRKFNSWGLGAEDDIFLGASYKSALRKIITARKLNVDNITPEQLSEIRDLAMKDALRATFREANWLAEGISKAKSNLMKGNAGQKLAGIALGGVFPFTKTPMNITKQALEHSPLGVFKTASDIVKKARGGAVSGNDIVADLARTFTGTGLAVLGFVLARAGFVSAGEDEDPDKKRFDKLVGEQSYAITIGGKSYTIDWATPASIPFLVGAQLFDATSDSGISIKTAMDSLTKIAEPVIGLSMLDGLRDFMQSDNYAEGQNPLFAGAYSTLESYVLQFFPTLGGKIHRVYDGEKKNYYFVDKNSNVPEFVQELYGSVASKLPFAVGDFQPSVDLWGRVENHGDIGERLAENLISPGYYSEENYTEVDEELLRLYESTGNGDVFPKKMYEDITIDSHKYYMNAEHYTEAAIMLGERRFDMLSRLFNDEIVLEEQDVPYSEMSDSEKAAIVESVYKQAMNETKANMFDKARENSAKYGDVPELDSEAKIRIGAENAKIFYNGDPTGENAYNYEIYSRANDFLKKTDKILADADLSDEERKKAEADILEYANAFPFEGTRGGELAAAFYDKIYNNGNPKFDIEYGDIFSKYSEYIDVDATIDGKKYKENLSVGDYLELSTNIAAAEEILRITMFGTESDVSTYAQPLMEQYKNEPWMQIVKAASENIPKKDEDKAAFYKSVMSDVRNGIKNSYDVKYIKEASSGNDTVDRLAVSKDMSNKAYSAAQNGTTGAQRVYWTQKYNFADQAYKAIQGDKSSNKAGYIKDLETLSGRYDGKLSRGDKLIAENYDKVGNDDVFYTDAESYVLKKSKDGITYEMPMSYHDYKSMTKYMDDAKEYAALYVFGNDSDKSSASKIRNQTDNMKTWVAGGLKAASSAMKGNYDLYKKGKLSADEYNAIYYDTLVGKIKSEIRAYYRQIYFKKHK